MASCMASLTIHYFEFTESPVFVHAAMVGVKIQLVPFRQEPGEGYVTSINGFQAFNFFYEITSFFFLLLISASQLCLSPEKQGKASFAPYAPANSAWTTSIISRGCYFTSLFVQSLHASHATRLSSSGPWWFTGKLIFSFSAHPWGFPLVWLIPFKEGKQDLACCAAVALMC